MDVNSMNGQKYAYVYQPLGDLANAILKIHP